MTQSPSKWPGRFKKKEMSPEEVKLFDKARVDCFSSCVVDNSTSPVDKLITYFSSWYKLKKTTAWILKFKAYVMSCRSKDIRLDKKLTVDDLRAAESALIMYEQRQCFGDVIQRMPNKMPVSKQSSVMKLDPIVVDGIMRVGGRLDRAPVGFEARHPIILAHVSHITHLIISHFHVLTGHGGIGLIMNSLFQRFWIIKATSAIRRVIINCTHCRLRYAKPNQQLMANLPQDRLQVDSHPFAYCGVDYFDPLIVRQKRSNIKRYGCLFTCLTTRAIHLEVATDLSADAFINALRRFLSRRGPVICMYSDNGTNLVGAGSMLREALQKWNEHQVQEFLLQKEIRWSFNPPSASHMGGVWERMIRSVRRILISLTSQRNLSDDQPHTFLLEAESILNSRPLSPVILDIDEQKPLTPYHLLKLHPTQALPPVLTSKEDCYAKRRWLYVQFLADQFWR